MSDSGNKAFSTGLIYLFVALGAVVTAALALVLPLSVIALGLLAASLVLFAKDSNILFYFILLLVPVDRFYFPLVYNLKAYQILLVCAVAFESFSALLRRKGPRLEWSLIDTAVVMVYACKLLSYPVSVNQAVYLKSVLLNGFFVLLYFYVRVKSEASGAERPLSVMICSSIAFISFGFLEYILWKFGIGSLQIARDIFVYAGRPSSVFKEPDWFGGYLTFVIGVTVPFLGSRPTGRARDIIYRAVFYMALMMSLLIVVRSVWLGLVAAAPILFVGRKVSFRMLGSMLLKTAVAAFMLLIVLSLIGPSFYDSIRDRFASIVSSIGQGRHDSAAIVRINSYDIICRYISANPLKGYGAGAWEFLSRYHEHINPALSANNILLTPLLECGLAGLAAFLFFTAGLLKIIFDGFRYSRTALQNQYALGIAVAVISTFVVGIFNDITLTGFYWAFIGLFASYVTELKKAKHEDTAHS